MALMQDYGLVFDIVICVLLVTTIGYAMALNRKLSLLRAAKRDMEKLFAEFAAATGEAQGGLAALKQHSAEAGETLAENVNDACRLADEMAFLVKKGNEIADRLEGAIAASRKATRDSEAQLRPGTPEATQAPAATASTLAGPAASALKAGEPAGRAPRGIAKLAKRKLSNADSELMRALQAIR
jgi:hypothetical protein